MKVMKFGGTSVGSPQRMQDVSQLITKSGEPTFVVLSAMSGTTNSLIEVCDYLYKKNSDGANEVINTLEKKYMKHVDELYYKFRRENYRCSGRGNQHQYGGQLSQGDWHKGFAY